MIWLLMAIMWLSGFLVGTGMSEIDEKLKGRTRKVKTEDLRPKKEDDDGSSSN